MVDTCHYYDFCRQMEKKDRKRWKYPCLKCTGVFQTRAALDAHQSSKLFQCVFPGCKQGFTHQNELELHQRNCLGRLKAGAYDPYRVYHTLELPNRKVRRYEVVIL